MSSVYSAAVAAALNKLVLYKSDYSALHVKDRGDLRNDQSCLEVIVNAFFTRS